MTLDTKTIDAPKGAPNTEALAPDALARAGIAVVTAQAKPPTPMVLALRELADAQAEHDEATRVESITRLAHVAAQTRVGRAQQRVTAASKGYDLALQQARRAQVDPAERRDAI